METNKRLEISRTSEQEVPGGASRALSVDERAAQQSPMQQQFFDDHIPSRHSPALPEEDESVQTLLSKVLANLVEGRRRAEKKLREKRRNQEAANKDQTQMARYLGKIPCIGPTLCDKYLNLKLVAYLEGRGVTSDDVDGLVNSVTLVNALILTIPPGIVTSLGINSGTWETLEDVIASCDIAGTELFWYEQIYIPIWKALVGGFVTSVFGLVVAILYYILRPTSREDAEEDEDEEAEGEGEGEVATRRRKSGFQRWWKRGRVGVLLLCMSVLTSAVCVFLVILYLMLFFVLNKGHLCDLVQLKADGGAWALLPMQESTIITSVCVYCLFFWAALWSLLYKGILISKHTY